MKWKYEHPTFAQALLLLVIGAIMGTVFTFGMQYWNETVAREECIYVETCFLDSRESYNNRNHLKEIYVECSNGEQYSIDSVCATGYLQNAIKEMEENTEIQLLIHPNSDTIVEFKVGENVLLDFDYASEKLSGEATGFFWLGIVLYAFGLIGLGYTIWHLTFGKEHRYKNF